MRILIPLLCLPLLFLTGCNRRCDCPCDANETRDERPEATRSYLQSPVSSLQSPIPFTPDAFLAAAAKGDAPRVQLFLSAGMSPDTRASGGSTALMWAAAQGRLEILNLLLASAPSGADVNAKSADNTTALFSAAEGGSLECARFLVAKGADIQARRLDGWTPLTAAAARGHDAVVAYLIECGSNPNQADAHGYTPLMYAAANINNEDPSDVTLLAAQMLVAKGADVNAKALDGTTALMRAAKKGEAPIVTLLLDHGADVAARDNEGRTALIYSVLLKAPPPAAKALLKHGANVSVQDHAGMTALMYAARRFQPGVLKALLEKDKSAIDAQDKEGQTALHHALLKGRTQCVALLVQAGAAKQIKNTRGQTPLDLAEPLHDAEITKALSAK